MYVVKLSKENFNADLAKEIARIANISRQTTETGPKKKLYSIGA
jgi:hypothetical protein